MDVQNIIIRFQEASNSLNNLDIRIYHHLLTFQIMKIDQSSNSESN